MSELEEHTHPEPPAWKRNRRHFMAKVGVTSPLFRGGDVRGGRDLAIWYVVGTALAGTAVFLVLKAASVGVSAVPAGPRYLGLGACVAILLVLDLLGRTPRVNRQTPQRL